MPQLKKKFLTTFLIIILFSPLISSEYVPMTILFETKNITNLTENYLAKFKKIFDNVNILFKTLLNIDLSNYRKKILFTNSKSSQCNTNSKDPIPPKISKVKLNYAIKIFPKFIKPKKYNILSEICKKANEEPVSLILEINNNTDFFEEVFESSGNTNYVQWLIIQRIIIGLIANKDYLREKKFYKNLGLDENYLNQYLYYWSIKKFTKLNNINFTRNIKDTISNKTDDYFITRWDNYTNLYDVLSNNFNYENSKYTTLSEITLNFFNDFPIYFSNKCDFEKFNEKCFRLDNNCFSDDELNNYFIEYTLTPNNKVICYLNNKFHYFNNQCGNLIGNILDSNFLNELKYSQNYKYKNPKIYPYIKKKSKNFLIETTLYSKQKLYLLNPSKTCPNKHPRTIYFFNEFEHENPPNINPYLYLQRNLNISEVEITDPKYFVISARSPGGYRGLPLKLNNIILGAQSKGKYNIRLSSVITSFFESNFTFYNISKYAKVGRFPDGNTYKDGINIYYNKYKKIFPKDFNYIPETYLWPQHEKIIKKKFTNYTYDPKNVWMFKPARDFGAHGVSIIDNYEDDILKQINITDNLFLITKYIMNPMLINKRKFDLRAFVLVTGFSPLKVYFYKDGYIRITMKEFNLDKKNIKDQKMHITTTLLNNDEKNYIFEKNLWDDSANFWNYLLFEKYCLKNGISYINIRNQMKDIITKTFITLRESFTELFKTKKLNEMNLFQLYAFDIMIDANYKVYLLEVNRLPTMAPDHISANYIYSHIVSDILNIVGIFPFAHDDTEKPYDDIYEYKNEIEEKVDDALCEFGRPTGMFERVFPLKQNINQYKKYFFDSNKENKLLWEKMFKQ